jgi:hypothetical protein
MMANRTTNRRAKNSMMAGNVAGYASYGRSCQATGLRSRRRTQSDETHGENGQISFHWFSPKFAYGHQPPPWPFVPKILGRFACLALSISVSLDGAPRLKPGPKSLPICQTR